MATSTLSLHDPISAIASVDPTWVPPLTTLRDAAGLLAANEFGALLVMGRDEVQGIITERDLVRAIDDDVDLDDERVRDHMTCELRTMEVTAPIGEAARTMLADEIRHVVVTDRGRVSALASIREVLRAAIGDDDE